MKAVIYEKKQLIYRELPVPEPKAGQVLVQIRAAAVNALDYRMMKLGIVPKGGIFGADISGEVTAAGAGVTEWKAGDAVIGELSDCGLGGFAEYVAAPVRALVAKPETLDWSQAAALGVAAETAYTALVIRGKTVPGERVLISGAGGGVGTYAVQLARHLGARVDALCGAGNLDTIREAGADRVYDYRKTTLRDLKEQYDLILLVNGRYTLGSCRPILAPKGRCVVIGGELSSLFRAMFAAPFLSLGSRKYMTLAYKTDRTVLESVVRLASERAFVPVIGGSYPLKETAAAVARISEGHNRGKLVISP